MHLLVVSHACAQPLNRGVYAEIQRLSSWRITIAVPTLWIDDYGGTLQCGNDESWARVLQLPVGLNGNIILHFYRTRLKRLLLELKPDVIYMHHEPYALATFQFCRANARCLRVPFGFYSAQNIKKAYPPPFSWVERMVYRNSQFAFPITEDVAGVMQAKGFAGRSAVCALPLDPEKYHPRLRAALPEGFGRGDGPVFGFVGRLTEAKGLRTLALALGKIRDMPWRLVVIGTGDFQNEFEALLVEAGVRDRVEFSGYIPHAQTPQWLAAMDVLVLPSETQSNWKEQFGRVIPEALSCGAAVVGSDSGEIPNLIRQSGGGLVFRERDPEALAEALRTMIKEPQRREEMASAGRAWVAKNISLDAVARRMIETFEAAIDRAKIANR